MFFNADTTMSRKKTGIEIGFKPLGVGLFSAALVSVVSYILIVMFY